MITVKRSRYTRRTNGQFDVAKRSGCKPLVIILLLIAAFLSWGFFNLARAKEAHAQVAVLGMKIEEKDSNIVILSQLNEQYKEKLENATKVEVDEATQKLVEVYVRKYFPADQVDEALKIVTCESHQSPKSINAANKNGSVDRGLWQINSVHKASFKKVTGVEWEVGAHDINLSTKFAKEWLFDNQNWNPWVCARIVGVVR